MTKSQNAGSHKDAGRAGRSGSGHVVPVPDVAPAPAPADAGLPRLGGGRVALLVAANFGVAMALMVPMAFSLALRADRLAPGNEAAVGYILGIGSALSLVTGPPVGTFSDRTRSRLGRRVPYLIGGGVLGMTSLVTMAYAPNIPVLGLGWALAALGWGTALGALGNMQADCLPPGQRGKVAGLTGSTTMVAPVLGVLLVGTVSDDHLLVLVLPGLVGAVSLSLLVVFFRQEDAHGLAAPARLTTGRLLGNYVFDPRAYPDFAWHLLARFVFYFGQSLYTSFVTFFYAQRLGLSLREVAGLVAVTGGISVVAMTAGTLGSGYLSDRLGRRRPFALCAASVFVAGTVISASAHALPGLLTGATLMNLGIAVFSATSQATVLDILPERETETGRFLAIVTLSQKLPGALAPLTAPLIISTATATDEKNYTLLYLTSGVFGLLGGLIAFCRVRGVR
ncbi:MAG TPA: MFS transporter [Streptomyces sp.]|uniref:MFS transporter n=1 Tax=Streptomyces sp. TaxID=1931 RepID=UPI002CFE22C9|nr:MFS transporter [Streptomyces sp.]HWU08904.1 MFS transporter [Streptomyces sp.]